MCSHRSLIIFTLLIQAAVGSCINLLIAKVWFPDIITSAISGMMLFISVGICLIGLVISIAHLGKPANSYNAIRNLKRSWLSKEILIVNFFTGSLVITIGCHYIFSGIFETELLITNCLVGLGAVQVMVKVYQIRTVPLWNHARTQIHFFASVLLLGSGLFMGGVFVIEGFQMVLQFQKISLIIAFIGFLMKLSVLWFEVKSTAYRSSKTRQLPIFQGSFISIWIISALFFPNWILFSLALLCLITGETMNRNQFYRSVLH